MRAKGKFPFNWITFLWSLISISLVMHLFFSLDDNPGWTDGIIYILQADYFSNWNAEHLPVIEQAMAYRSFPPLYPFYLSILGTGSDSIILASIATSILLLPICLLYVNWQIKEGIAKANALINAILFLLLPSTLLFSTELWSENLYLLLVFLTLWSFSKSNNNTYKWLYISAFTCGLALITRSVGISLAIALLIVVYRQDKSKIIFTTIIIFIPLLIWTFISSGIAYDQTYLDQGFLDKYKGLISLYGSNMDAVISIIQIQLQTLWWGLQLQFNNLLNNGTAILAILIIITASYSLYRRFIYLTLDALYIIIYFGIIFVWNFPEQNVRFIYVIIPFILFYTQTTTSLLFNQFNKNINIFVSLSIPFLIVTTILPCLIFMTNRLVANPGEHAQHFINDRHWLTGMDTEEMYKHLIFKKRLIESAIEIKEIVPQEECIYSIHQEFVMLYSRRRSIVPPLQDVSQEEFIEEITQCRYMFIVANAHKDHEPLYPVDRVKNISWILHQSFYSPEYGGEIISVLLEIDKVY